MIPLSLRYYGFFPGTILILFFTAGCKKFPEGGFHRNAKKIFNSKKGSTWDLIKYEVNGIDSTGLIVSNNDPEQLNEYVRFFKYGYDQYSSIRGFFSQEIEYAGDELTMYSDGKAYHTFASYGTKIRQALTPNGGGMTWKILKCKKGEMVLHAEKGGFEYRVVLRE